MYHVLFDLKYMCRSKTLQYVIYETDFIECLLEQLPKFYYQDVIEYQNSHVMFDSSLFKEGLYNIDIQLTKIFKQYLKEVDPFNIPRNKRLMQAFITFFREVD